MDIAGIVDFWLTQGGEALRALLLSQPVESVRGEIIFPPGLPRDVLFTSAGMEGRRPFCVQREVEGKVEVVEMVFSVLVVKRDGVKG